MDRLSDTRSLGSGRSRGKQRLPLPSQQGTRYGNEENDLLSQFSDSQPSRSGKSSKRNLPLPSEMGDLGSDLLSSLVSSDSLDIRSNPSKRSTNRKKLPLPSEGINGTQSLLGEFLEPASSSSTGGAPRSGLAPNFNSKEKRKPSLLDENDLLERLSSLSSKSTGSKNGSRKNLPRPSDLGNGKKEDDLLAMFSSQGETEESVIAETYETIVYDPDEEDNQEQEDFFDEAGGMALSPRDVINQASDVLSLLSGHEGGIRPTVLTSRGKYSDDDSRSSGSRDRPASKVSGTGYVSDRSSYVSGSNRTGGVTASLTNSMGGHNNGPKVNQNRAFFLRTAELRKRNERKPNSPLNKFLPGGSMSSVRDIPPEPNNPADTELIEQLQLELEEARRTIRSHETKIMTLQDEVEAARESCMEEECERVEAEIQKERVHNENRMLKAEKLKQSLTLVELKVQLQSLESFQSSSDKSTPVDDGHVGRGRRPMSALEPRTLSSIAIQTDQSEPAMRMVRSMGDVGQQIKMTTSLEQLEEKTAEDLLSDVEEADGILIPIKDSDRQVAVPFRKSNVGYKVSIISHWVKSLVLRESDFSGSLYSET